MKRFFCTVCQRQVRVRALPESVRPIIDNVTGEIIRYSDGVCRYHSQIVSRQESSSDRSKLKAERKPHQGR